MTGHQAFHTGLIDTAEEAGYLDPDDDNELLFSTSHQSASEFESPETADTQELNKNMSYWETVRSVCSFMGLTHIPDFDSIYGLEWEKSTYSGGERILNTMAKYC